MEQLDLLAWTEPAQKPAQRVTIICADIEDVDLSAHGPFDALFSDPPYGLKFMGKAWDRGVPGPAIWAHLATFLRSGANIAAFGGTRTYHRLACAIEDAGLEIRDSVWAYCYGSGFPKPANVAKYIDRRGLERRPDRAAGSGQGQARAGRQARGVVQEGAEKAVLDPGRAGRDWDNQEERGPTLARTIQ